ncbi:ABC transporter permease subunit [Oceanobacillus longus]|uniref:ABC transporter permease subunit n=1 Tax=Oceanobacillus longus TaxID=930120 RepID=A0ABV8GR31_9BACI
MVYKMKKHYSLYLMILPIFIYFIIFNYYPVIKGFIISLQDFKLIGDRPFIGFQNYITVLNDPVFWRVVQNTLLIGGGILLLGFIAPLVVALSLNEVFQPLFKKVTQMVIYLPHLFSWVVVGGIWIYILSPDAGLVNGVLQWIGVGPIHFFAQEEYAKPIMILSAIWKDMGYTCIIYLAAIVGISPTMYEAAKIDGANRWKQMIYITLPQLVPTMKVVLLLNIMGILRIFDQVFVMSNPAIAREVNVIMMYVYEKGILEFEMGVATAAAFLVVFATLILVSLVRKGIRFDME